MYIEGMNEGLLKNNPTASAGNPLLGNTIGIEELGIAFACCSLD
jgi:hypothetical protein